MQKHLNCSHAPLQVKPSLGDVPRKAGESVALIRQHASTLLDELRAAQAASDQRLADVGRVDPMKSVTGQSALDRAIEETERLIASLDEPVRSRRSSIARVMVEPNLTGSRSWHQTAATG